MKFVVISDLHAFTSDARRTADGRKPLPPSYIDFSAPHRRKVEDPLVGLRELFEGNTFDGIDLLIVAGDIGDRADPVAIRSAWSELSEIAGLKGTKVMATCGNHDIDTRHKTNKFDPKGFLRTLTPSFPIAHVQSDDRAMLEYWANNYTIIEESNYRVLNINSCAFHGYGVEHEKELEHGRVSDITLDGIERTITASYRSDPTKHNICLIHHHLKQVSNDSFEDTSTVKGAERLTELLSRADLGEWLIIHGHRHRSNLFCSGGNTAPIVLSCASFAATRIGDEQNPCPNQFYLIDLDQSEPMAPSKASGTIKTWNWTPSYGWIANNNIVGGLPPTTGFGFRGRIAELAERMRNRTKLDQKLNRKAMEEQFPDYLRLMPSDLKSLIHNLEQLGIIVSLNGQEIEELVAPDE
jgi:Icc-related predicted phosphoesterase